MKTIKPLLCIVLTTVISGCGIAPVIKGNEADSGQAGLPQDLRFVATEFTRPYIEVSPDGSEFFFDALGEIYRVPLSGGRALQVDLGTGWKTSPVISDDGQWLVHVSDADQDRSNLQFWGKKLGTEEATRQLGILWLTRVGSPELKASAYIYQGLQERWNVATGTLEPTDFALEGFEGQFRISRDGGIVGYETLRDGKPVLAIHRPEAGTTEVTACGLERKLPSNFAPTYAFLPDGESVLVSRGGKFHRCWFNGRSVEIAVSAVIDKRMSPMAMPQGELQQRTQIRYPVVDMKQKRLIVTAKGKLWQSDLSEGEPTRLTDGEGEELMPALSHDGSRIAYVVQDGRAVTLRARELANGRERVVLSSDKVSFANPAWSPDGKRLAFVEVQQKYSKDNRDSIKVVDLGSGAVHAVGFSPSTPLNGATLYPRPAWSAQGDAIYYTRDAWVPGGGVVDHIDLVRHPLDAEPVVLLTMQPAIQDAVVSPDGKQAALRDRLGVSVMELPGAAAGTDARMRYVSLTESRQSRSRLWLNGPDYLAWTQDGRLLWSIQDEIFVGTDPSNTERLAQLKLPPNTQIPEGIKVYLGGRILTMGTAGDIEQGAIVTEGKQIRYVGEVGSLPSEFATLPPIDIRGKTVIPGLVDVHRHTEVSQDDFTSQRNYSLFANVAYGVTTIYDPSIHTVKSAYLTDLSRDDGFLGPTVYGSGLPLLGDDLNGAYAYIGGIADARAYMDRASKAGVPLIKAYFRETRSDRALIAQAAREFGIGVASHEYNNLPTQLSQVQDGYTAIEHTLFPASVPFYADVVEYLKKSSVMLTPTIADTPSNLIGAVMWKRTSRDHRFACLIDGARQRRMWEEVDLYGKPLKLSTSGDPEIPVPMMNHIREYAAMLNAGISVSIGAHDLPAGLGSHWEMWTLAQGGATPMNVLKAATVNGAYKLGMQNRIGSLAEGMDADFVILNTNPLDDIYSTTDISRVVRRGRTVQWPEGTRWPQSWPDEADWTQCQTWNFYMPRTEPDAQHMGGGGWRESRRDLTQTWDQRADVLRLEVEVRGHGGVAVAALEGRRG